MSELDDEELLDSIRKQRKAREIRREAIDFLRARTVRNVPLGVTWIVIIIGSTVARLWIEGRSDGNLVQGSVPFWILTLTSVYMAARCFHASPRDRLLLLLAEEAMLKIDRTSGSEELERRSSEEK